MANRKFNHEAELHILEKSRRRCAFCYHFNNDVEVKLGQIAHINRDPSISSEDNLAYLCLDHHNEYDSKFKQTKNYKPEELIIAKSKLEKLIHDNPDMLRYNKLAQLPNKEIIQKTEISLDLYEKRIPIYEAFLNFLFLAIHRAKIINNDELNDFSNKSKHTLFLFGNEIEELRASIFKKVVELRALQLKINESKLTVSNEIWYQLIDDETKKIVELNGIWENLRYRFYPYLKLGPN